MHDCDNPDNVGLVNKNDRIRKNAAEITASWRIKFAEMFWIDTNFQKPLLHLPIKALTKVR